MDGDGRERMRGGRRSVLVLYVWTAMREGKEEEEAERRKSRRREEKDKVEVREGLSYLK